MSIYALFIDCSESHLCTLVVEFTSVPALGVRWLRKGVKLNCQVSANPDNVSIFTSSVTTTSTTTKICKENYNKLCTTRCEIILHLYLYNKKVSSSSNFRHVSSKRQNVSHILQTGQVIVLTNTPSSDPLTNNYVGSGVKNVGEAAMLRKRRKHSWNEMKDTKHW